MVTGQKKNTAKTKRRPTKQSNVAKGAASASATSSTASAWLHRTISVAVVLLAVAWQFTRRNGGGVSIAEASAVQFGGASNADFPQNSDLGHWVDVIPGVLPASVCNEIIVRSEQIRYRLMDDSIDEGDSENYDQRTQEIYILHKLRGVVQQSLYSLIEPHAHKLTVAIRKRRQLVSDEFANERFFTDPKPQWIFLRKYYPLGPLSKRNSLKVHTDSNMHSVTLALNDNYVGGGLFVVRPPKGGGPTDSTFRVPEMPIEYSSYRWMHDQEELAQRRNSSKIFFPDLPQGSAALINFTVPHGVAPLAQETPIPRYALIFFYDMDVFKDKIAGHQTAY